ncbi:acyltransferase family protein [Ruegeria sp. HKCCA0235A]
MHCKWTSPPVQRLPTPDPADGHGPARSDPPACLRLETVIRIAIARQPSIAGIHRCRSHLVAQARHLEWIMTGNLKDQRAHGLDSLRGIAASAVVFVHAVKIHPLGVDYTDWGVDYFSMGVPLFFIISAMSMSLAYPKGVP